MSAHPLILKHHQWRQGTGGARTRTMSGRVLMGEVFRRLHCVFFVGVTLWSEAAWASSGGTACRHFEQCPKSYIVLFSLLGPYLLWLAWSTFSNLFKRQDCLLDQKKTKQTKARKNAKKDALNQKELLTPAPGDRTAVAAEERRVTGDTDHSGWLFVELFGFVLVVILFFVSFIVH